MPRAARRSKSQPGENAMKPAAVLFGACALLPLLAGAAGAQQCKTEIDNVAKLLASRDAGAGPTTGAAGSAGGTASSQAGPPQHPPTGRMGQATPGGAASPQDVQSQTRGEPTATQKAEGARAPAAEKLASAQAALARARELDRSGNEADCMRAIAEAKQAAQ
jgi:hypothetical protein